MLRVVLVKGNRGLSFTVIEMIRAEDLGWEVRSSVLEVVSQRRRAHHNSESTVSPGFFQNVT